MIASVDTTKELLIKYNINPKQRYGQNFMVVDKTPKIIADHPSITNESLVIEIGPGLGALTEVLAEKAKHVLCIEIDTQLYNLLKSEFQNTKNIEVINKDFLKFDLASINYEKYSNVVVVSNLPYYITSDILNKLILDEHDFIVIAMMQKEVADRIIKASDFNTLVLATNLFTKIKKLCDVSKNDYFPKPNVDSSVLVFKKQSIKEKRSYFYLIENLFKQKRKTIYNNINEMVKPYKMNEKFVSDILLQAKINNSDRMDGLEIKQISKLLELLHTKINFLANAKVNLGLVITGKTYEKHNIESLFVPIGIYDELNIFKINDLQVEYQSNKIFDFNIFQKIYCKYKNVLSSGYFIDLNKGIPVSAGLGGGSSDLSVFSKVLFNEIDTKEKPTYEEFCKQLIDISTDSAFFEINKPAILKNISNYEVANVDYLKEFKLLILVPDIEISTQKCFEKFDELNSQISPIHVDFTTLNGLKSTIHNDLEKAAFELKPELKDFKNKILEFNPEIVTMSGSGPAYVVLDKGINKLKEIESNLKNECRFCKITEILFNN